jgi:hypothetical protein
MRLDRTAKQYHDAPVPRFWRQDVELICGLAILVRVGVDVHNDFGGWLDDNKPLPHQT